MKLLKNYYTISSKINIDVKKLIKSGNYESIIVKLMNQSSLVFQGTYSHLSTQSNGECDFIDITTKEKFDAKIPLNEKQGKMIGSRNGDFDAYDAYAFLAGNGEEAGVLVPPLRTIFEDLREGDKPFFSEFMSFVGYYPSETEKMDHQRMTYQQQNVEIEGLEPSDILDGHYNDCCIYQFLPPTKDLRIILDYHNYINAHDHIDLAAVGIGALALWMLDDKTLISSMRICNFNRARFAPEKKWQCVIKFILDFLMEEKTTPVFPEPICTFNKDAVVEKPADTDEAVQMGLNWFIDADMLVDNGYCGVQEGLSHHISARDGVQKRVKQVRTE